jgi:hypothetical protein
VRAEARGFVRADLKFPEGKLVIKPGETAELNFELVRGEVLAGVVSVPERLRDRLLGNKMNAQQHMFRVRSRSLEQIFLTELGGAFEVWVPKGIYTLDLVAPVPPKGPGQGSSWEAVGAALENVASGTRSLKLQTVDPAVSQEAAARAFDAIWDDMALKYSYFELKKIDWNALKTKYRPRAVAAATLPQFVDVLGEMLGELHDGHVRFIEPHDAVVAYWPQQRRSNNFQAIEKTMEAAGLGRQRLRAPRPGKGERIWRRVDHPAKPGR